MIDFSQVSTLPDSKIKKVQQLMEDADYHDDNLEKVRNLASEAFKIVAPKCDVPMLFSAVKDYRMLDVNITDAKHGIHVIRSWFANKITRSHREEMGNRFWASIKYDEDGYVLVPDILSHALRNKIRDEIKKFPLSVNKQPFNIIRDMGDCGLRDAAIPRPSLVPGIREYVLDCTGFSMTDEDFKLQYLNNTFVQRLHNTNDDHDIQKTLHHDTFFPATKFWYFPDDVTEENGPLEYIPKSHLFTQDRANWIYEQSILCHNPPKEMFEDRSVSHVEGSMRLLDSDVFATKLEKPKQIIVPSNTLVIANVFGFHRRGNVPKEGKRDAIHGSIRVTRPFE